MSLAVAIKGPEGVVLAADSRVSLTAESPGAPPFPVNFDHATKLLSFAGHHKNVGAVTYGAAIIGEGRTAHSFLPEFDSSLEGIEQMGVPDFAERLGGFFMDQWKSNMPGEYKGASMMFIVGGYDPGSAYGRVYLFDVPRRPDPVEQNPGSSSFGMTWGGQLQIASRIIHGYDPGLVAFLKAELDLEDDRVLALLTKAQQALGYTIPYSVLPLQDCVDLATFMIRTTIQAQDLAITHRGVGGPIDVAVITRTNGLQFIQRKEVTIPRG